MTKPLLLAALLLAPAALISQDTSAVARAPARVCAGGDVTLGDSPTGGLRAAVRVPV